MVSKQIVESLLSLNTTQAIWNDLKHHFHQSNGLWVFQLKQSLNTLSQGAMDISAYVTELKVLLDELRTYQHGIDYQ